MITDKIAKIEQDILSRLERIKSFKCDNSGYYVSRNIVFSLTSLDAILLFGLSNNKLENAEKMISMLINGLYDDGALVFSMVNGRSILRLVNDDLDGIQRISKDELRDMVHLFNLAAQYSKIHSNTISQPLSDDYGKESHPSGIYNMMIEKAEAQAMSLGWQPNTEKIQFVLDEI